MSNFKNELNNYQAIPRKLIFDSTMSDRARFVYCFMASKPDGWDFYLTPMAKEIGYSVDTLRKYINELVEHGWLEKGEQEHLEGSLFGSVPYVLKAEPTKTSDTENFRHGEMPTQKERDNNRKDIKDNKEDTKKDELFEECWKLYQRKGSKAVSRKEWAKLKEEEKLKVKEHIPYYVSSQSEKTFQKDFERYLKKKIFNNVVYKGNTTLFDPEQVSDSSEYRPRLDGRNMLWLESEKCYMTTFDLSMLNDGYTNENRPASAIIMYNGWRYQWNVTSKKWERL